VIDIGGWRAEKSIRLLIVPGSPAAAGGRGPLLTVYRDTLSEGFSHFATLVAEVSYPSSAAERWRQPILNIPHGPLAQVAARKSSLHTPDLAVEKDYLKIPAVADLVKLGGIRTMLIVPMLSNDTEIGAITVSRTRVLPFTEKEIEMVTDFAAQATIALEATQRAKTTGGPQSPSSGSPVRDQAMTPT
jgi:GAF domain-containing protein